ncbi:hypothetical protein [Agaribacterium sp. ZY112]|uniref:hypothetical protein n=1 Tax=Agaribacterium sp. ZY112 TaxID=3233574 RepID=UPI0035259959
MKIELITTPNQILCETGFDGFNACQDVINLIQKMGHSCNISSYQFLADLDDV